MPEPLKNIYTQDFIHQLSTEIKKSYRKFDADAFKSHVFNDAWLNMELKQRMRHIAESLKHFIPKNYAQSLKILKPAATKFGGFESMFFPDYVELYGLEEFDLSMDALGHFTRYSSSEFAVRPFIKKYPKKMMRQMNQWSKSDNYHERRLASEGCRPRLPWAMALPEFKKDPSMVLKVIARLKNDEREYVRRSVANNLNDISKDNPDVVMEIAKKWLGKTPETDWLVKHACRTLLKAGQVDVLALFGFEPATDLLIENWQMGAKVKLGEELAFSFTLKRKKTALKKLRIEYAIYFMKANSKQSRKVFKISEGDYAEFEKDIARFYSFRPISTRKYYTGEHALAIIVNGMEMDKHIFMVTKT